MDDREIKMRCIEAAAKASYPSSVNGHAAGALEAASIWFDWITSGRPTLSLKSKSVKELL